MRAFRRSSSAMRSLSAIPTLSTLILLLHFLQLVIATPLSLNESALEVEQNTLEKRKACSNPCGYNGWLCCGSSQTCNTNSAGEAECLDGSSSGSGSGSWQYYTTTYVVTETDQSTITSVWSSHIASPTGTCRVDLGEVKCGTTCCDAAQECQDGACVAESSSVAVTGSEATATGEASPGVRETSSGASTVTQTSAPTTTQGFIAPVGTDGADLIGVKATNNGGGLSGGAIAGIVIGTIAGVILLLLLCGCLCFKGALDALLAAMGIRKRRRRETTVEERYSHHSHGSRPRPPGRTWFGTRPAAAGTESSVSEKESKWSGWGTVAIILGALALCLGLKRHRDREHEDDDKTSYTYPSSYYYSDYTRSKPTIPNSKVEKEIY